LQNVSSSSIRHPLTLDTKGNKQSDELFGEQIRIAISL